MKTVLKGILKILVLSFCFFQLESCLSCKEDTVTKIDVDSFKTEISRKNVQLIDVRTPKEYERGHIDGALNFNVNDTATFLNQISTLDKKEPVYLYCKMGGRSNRAAEVLKNNDFKKIYDYSGGYDEWSKNSD